MLPVDLGPASEPGGHRGESLGDDIWVTPFPGTPEASPAARYDSRESVELAFVAALQTLPSRQRATLLLRDVLGFTAAETAEVLDSSVASVNSALNRAPAQSSDASQENDAAASRIRPMAVSSDGLAPRLRVR